MNRGEACLCASRRGGIGSAADRSFPRNGVGSMVFLSNLVNGISLGSIYAVIALGYRAEEPRTPVHRDLDEIAKFF